MNRLRSILMAVATLVVAVAPARAADPSGTVTGVSVVSSPGRAEVVVRIRGAFSVEDFVLHNPERLVLDVKGARLEEAAGLYDGVNRAGILNVRIAQFSPEIVRIVLDMSELKDYTLERDDETIRVIFGADRTFLVWSSIVPAEERPRPLADRRTSQPEVVLPPPGRGEPFREQGEPRITATWDNADIADVVAGFAAFSGRTIILGKDVTGTVSAEVKNQPWPQAFKAILVSQGLSATEMEGGIIRVDSPAVLAALDSLEPLTTTVMRVNYARASTLAKSIEGILTKNRGSVVADTTTNSLIITDTRSRLPEIERFASGLDVRTPQISIQAKIIFVDRTDLQQLGLQYDLGSNSQFFNKLVQRVDPNTGDPFDPNVNIIDLGGNSVSGIANADATITGSALDLVFSTAMGGFKLTTFLSALQRVELADVQAEPTISTLDNFEADILVGEETPVRVIDASSAAGGEAPRATVQFKETGIRLTVTPHVTNNRQIIMDLKTERSAVQALAASDLGFNFAKQVATNRLLVNDGETAVIGGLTVTEVT
ncbi:MAG: secretin N-terminal domain-containing protein, partial [Gemmatimonadales bacterium]